MADLCVDLVPLFTALPQDEKIKLERLVQHQNYQKGEIVIDPTVSANLVIVAHGSTKLYTLDETGHEDVLQVLHTGDYVGEDWLFGQVNTHSYVEATDNSEICLLRRQDFFEVDPSAARIRLLELSMTKISAMQKQIQLLTLPKVEERLFKYLQMYANEIGQNSFVLPLKLKDLALYLGTTPETLSRKFALLEEQGRLRRKLRQIDLI